MASKPPPNRYSVATVKSWDGHSGRHLWMRLTSSSTLSRAKGLGFITADVADSLTAQPIYELVLFTAHPDGLWEMANAMSFARQDWREYLVKQEEDKNQGQLVMRALDFDDDPDAWTKEIASNIRNLLTDRQTVSIRRPSGRLACAPLAGADAAS